MKEEERKIVVVNQAANYLTVGICNEFQNRFGNVALITANVHAQGEALNNEIEVSFINKWKEEHGVSKAFNYLKALLRIYFLLLIKFRKYEVFFISVPPMAYLLNLILTNRCSMIIWDVYPDVLKITGMKENHFVYRIWSRLNEKSFNKAFRVFTIGDKMGELLSKYVSTEKVIIQPIWSIFQDNDRVSKHENPFVLQHNLQGKFIIQYSGNIGLTHNVEVLIRLAEKMKDHKNVLFQIIGRGPRKKYLEELVSKKSLENCQFLPFQSDDMFPYSLSAADVGVVILDDLTSKGSVPSKSYNLMSYGIPGLYIASPDSELSEYSKKYNHAGCFTDKELDNAEKFLLTLDKNSKFYDELSLNNLKASKNYKRTNAKKLVDRY